MEHNCQLPKVPALPNYRWTCEVCGRKWRLDNPHVGYDFGQDKEVVVSGAWVPDED